MFILTQTATHMDKTYKPMYFCGINMRSDPIWSDRHRDAITLKPDQAVEILSRFKNTEIYEYNIVKILS